MKSSDCLLIIDLQNDFCPGGALAVPKGHEIVKPVNRLMKDFPLIVSTQDWHPDNHCSFQAQGGPWPPHCVQNTPGAELHAELNREAIQLKVRKGDRSDRDAYSGFDGTELGEELKHRGVKRIFMAGLATDYCVKETALDARKKYGFKTVVLTDLIQAIDARPGDGAKALKEMQRAGGILTKSSELTV